MITEDHAQRRIRLSSPLMAMSNSGQQHSTPHFSESLQAPRGGRRKASGVADLPSHDEKL